MTRPGSKPGSIFEGGTLTTVPLVFSGERLEVNTRVKPGGSATVEVLDVAERPIAGFGRSVAIRGDHLRAPVVWPGVRKIGELRGNPVCLCFRLRNAELYSFAFRPGASAA